MQYSQHAVQTSFGPHPLNSLRQFGVCIHYLNAPVERRNTTHCNTSPQVLKPILLRLSTRKVSSTTDLNDRLYHGDAAVLFRSGITALYISGKLSAVTRYKFLTAEHRWSHDSEDTTIARLRTRAGCYYSDRQDEEADKVKAEASCRYRCLVRRLEQGAGNTNGPRDFGCSRDRCRRQSL